MGFYELLEERYNLLTKSEKKIAEYISKSEGKIIYNPMSTVKEEVGVGDATIIRFCNKLGFSGFSDLKIEIAKEDFSKNHFNSKYDYINESEEKITKSIKNTKKYLRDDSLNKAINMIKEASNIYLFGVGSSGNTCKDFEAMLLRVGIKAKAVTDPHFQAQLSSILDNNDLVIGFSLSGKTKDTFESLFLAKESFAKIISITNNKLSPIANLSDIVLQTSTNEFFDGASLAGKISQLYICDILIKGFELEDDANTIEIREKVIRSVLDKSID